MLEVENYNELKQEAIERMKILKLDSKIIKDFKEKNKIYKSEKLKPYLMNLNEEEKQMVKKFEDENNFIVYHIIHSISNLGETYDLLYITQEIEEWKNEKLDLKNGFSISKTEVIHYKTNSEIGIIGIESKDGGIIRVC